MKLEKTIAYFTEKKKYHEQEKLDFSKKAEIYRKAGEEEAEKYHEWSLGHEIEEMYYEQAIIALKNFN